jgi:hypothetical protein
MRFSAPGARTSPERSSGSRESLLQDALEDRVFPLDEVHGVLNELADFGFLADFWISCQRAFIGTQNTF